MRGRLALVVAVILSMIAGAVNPASAQQLDFRVTLVADGFDRPVHVADAGDGTGRLFVVEQEGVIRVIRDGQILPEPFLDVTSDVGCCGERGLLSIAFHPQFAENGTFFVYYTNKEGDTRVVRYRVDAGNPDRADPASAETLLAVEQPASNHNGGLLLFGPDGYLYIGLGDGGGGNGQNGQDLGTPLGKILRIDVDRRDPDLPYAIPPDNPFVERAGARPEIWAYGLRNPWRFSFDRETGELWIGDVGSALYEEINFQPANVGGLNFGWDLMEGTACRASDCEGLDLFVPVGGFSREEGCVITGGYVYRGSEIPALRGTYLYADYCSGDVWGLVPEGDDWRKIGPVATGLRIVSFGEDAAGELYLVDLGGGVYRITG